MGRTIQTSNPTEVDSTWNYAGGDDNSGYVWSQQSYDWKSRPLVTTNQDGGTKQYTYGGCGCTGEATVTITDEVGRKTRQTSDVYLDNATQVSKTEVLDSSNNIYSTTAQINDILNRKSYVREYKGIAANYMACPSGDCQESWMQYDGYGRTFRRHGVNEVGATPYTEFQYYADGSVQKATDARKIETNYLYNNRSLVTQMSYSYGSGANSAIALSPTVSYLYDVLGKRTKMTDGLGEVNYGYDISNNLTSESRVFSNLTLYNSSNFISKNNVIATYNIGYEYDSVNRLKKITDPWGGSVSYQKDLSGRVTTMTADGYGNYDPYNNAPITSIVSNVKYRAFDALKEFDTGTVASLSHFAYRTCLQLGDSAQN